MMTLKEANKKYKVHETKDFVKFDDASTFFKFARGNGTQGYFSGIKHEGGISFSFLPYPMKMTMEFIRSYFPLLANEMNDQEDKYLCLAIALSTKEKDEHVYVTFYYRDKSNSMYEEYLKDYRDVQEYTFSNVGDPEHEGGEEPMIDNGKETLGLYR